MTKQEWKTKYSSARLMLNARFFCGHDNYYHLIPALSNEPARKEAWSVIYQAIGDMGYGIREACFHDTDFGYPYKPDASWKIKLNLKHR